MFLNNFFLFFAVPHWLNQNDEEASLEKELHELYVFIFRTFSFMMFTCSKSWVDEYEMKPLFPFRVGLFKFYQIGAREKQTAEDILGQNLHEKWNKAHFLIMYVPVIIHCTIRLSSLLWYWWSWPGISTNLLIISLGAI